MHFSSTAVGVTTLFMLARLTAATLSDVAAASLRGPGQLKPGHSRFTPYHRHESGENDFVSHYYRHRLTDDRYPSIDKRSGAPHAGQVSSHTSSSHSGAFVPIAHFNDQKIKAASHSSAPTGGIPKNKHKRGESGQAPSLTSSNNFINFVSHSHITNGQQVKDGSHNPVPMGGIPKHKHKRSESGQVSSHTSNSHSGGVVWNSHITNGQQIRGGSQHPAPVGGGTSMHKHRRRWSGSGNQAAAMNNAQIQALQSKLHQLEAPRPPPTTFRSADNREKALFGRATPTPHKVNFNAMNKAKNDVSSHGLPPGDYRLCTMTSAANHQPVVMPTAQRGSQDDCIRFSHRVSHH